MQINSIFNVSFDGKIKYDRTLSESKKVFVEKILDYKKNGKTLRERITRSNFDVVVDSFEEKETLHPKLYFYSKFKKLRPTNHYEDAEKYTYFSKDLKIDSSIKNGAKHLERFLNDFEKKRKNYYNICNTSYGRMKETVKRFLGIR